MITGIPEWCDQLYYRRQSGPTASLKGLGWALFMYDNAHNHGTGSANLRSTKHGHSEGSQPLYG